MNLNIYSAYYREFHRCSISSVVNDVMIFNLGYSPYETFMISRMYPVKKISIDSNKPLLLALKSFFKSDVTASVICNDHYLWTICLGKERMIYPINPDVKPSTTVRLFATPYFVIDPQTISHYLQGTIRPAYENVHFYKNTILYLDNQDLPFPGGFYFDECEPSKFYRICFLSSESDEYVLNLISEWKSRRNILTIPYITKETEDTIPKFIDFKPIPEFTFLESNILSLGEIHRNLSSNKPEHLIQDILNSYYKSINPNIDSNNNIIMDDSLGLIIQWPIKLTFEWSRPSSYENYERKCVALCVNGNDPKKVIYASHPYDRYMEYDHVPAAIWTPISFAYKTLPTPDNIFKVALDTVVIGLVYREMFFCFNQPLLEGRPTEHHILNTKYLLSVVDELPKDPNLQIIEHFKYNENYSLNRVSLRGIMLETWCLTKSKNTHPYPKNINLPFLVKEWLRFLEYIGPNTFDVDADMVRLALTLSKHNICYNLIPKDRTTNPIDLKEDEVNFYMNEQVINFINEARLSKPKNDEEDSCVIS